MRLLGLLGVAALVGCGTLIGIPDRVADPELLVADAGSDVGEDADTGITKAPDAADAAADADADAKTPCLKCGDVCVVTCAGCTAKPAECNGSCLASCDECSGATVSCPGCAAAGGDSNRIFCRSSVEACAAVCNGAPCTSQKECTMGSIVCDLGHCGPCDTTNDMKGLACSNGILCDARHCQ